MGLAKATFKRELLVTTFGTARMLMTAWTATFGTAAIVVWIGAGAAGTTPIPRQKRSVNAPIAEPFVEAVFATQHSRRAIVTANIGTTSARIAAGATMFVQVAAPLLNPATARLCDDTGCKQAEDGELRQQVVGTKACER